MTEAPSETVIVGTSTASSSAAAPELTENSMESSPLMTGCTVTMLLAGLSVSNVNDVTAASEDSSSAGLQDTAPPIMNRAPVKGKMMNFNKFLFITLVFG